MAKKQAMDTALFDTLRATGLRKKVARTISASGARAHDNHSLLVQQTARGLRMAATAIENRAAPHTKTATDGGATKTGNAKKRPAPASKSRPRTRNTAKRTSARTAGGTKRAARSGPTRGNQRSTGARTKTRTRARH